MIRRDTILTKGWDTISIVSEKKINSDIKRIFDSIDKRFYYSISDDAGYIEGIFSNWKIISGGGGRILRMEVPVETGILSLNGEQICIDGVIAVVEVTLSLLLCQSDVVLLKSQYNRLAKDREMMTEDKKGWVLPITLIDTEKKTGIYANVVLDSICNYMISNSRQFEMIFAEISSIKSGCPDWIFPKKCAYSYLENGYLAILAVCTNRDIFDLPLDVDVSGIVSNADSYFILSTEMLMKHLILPGLIPIYQNANEESYTIWEREMSNKYDLYMHEIKSGAIYYTPKVYRDRNIVRINGEQVRIEFFGECDMYAGIYMFWNGSVTLKAYLESNGTVAFYKTGSSFSDNEDIPWYLCWLLPIVGLIVQIVVAIISDSLIESISKRSSEIKANNINTTIWFGNETNVKEVYISESLILQYG